MSNYHVQTFLEGYNEASESFGMSEFLPSNKALPFSAKPVQHLYSQGADMRHNFRAIHPAAIHESFYHTDATELGFIGGRSVQGRKNTVLDPTFSTMSLLHGTQNSEPRDGLITMGGVERAYYQSQRPAQNGWEQFRQ